jgi:flavin-dependent dehydrogenase
VVRCDRLLSGGWQLTVAGHGPLVAAYLVDATGRASPLRRALGARWVVHDHMVALVGSGRAGDDHRALIEATPDGWWYSAGLPDGRLVLAFHTDAAPGLRAAWARHLAAAPHTSARAAGAPTTGVRHVAAGTQRLEPAACGSWLAAGDAAAAHDPIAGLGVYWALESGISAAHAIVAGDPDAMAAYSKAAEARFGDYLAQRAMYYRAERRWPESPFWRRRRQPIT